MLTWTPQGHILLIYDDSFPGEVLTHSNRNNLLKNKEKSFSFLWLKAIVNLLKYYMNS